MLGLCAALLLGAVSPPGQRPRRTAKKPVPPARTTDLAVPFSAGERLDYQVQWVKLTNAATIRLDVVERGLFFGQPAWHFQAQAHTLNPLRFLFALDDQFDSYTETTTLTALQYEMYLNEGGKTQTTILRMSTRNDPAPANAALARVVPGTRDPVGFLYSLRAVDWERTRELHSPVFDGRKLYEVVASREIADGQVVVPAGTFAASRIEIRVFERGKEVDQTRFWVWLAHDAVRTPVLMEVELPFGNARVELASAELPH